MKKETIDIFHHSGTKMHIRKDGTIDITGVKDVNINISGNANINVNGNVTTKIGGNWKVNIGGTTDIISGGNMTLKAPRIDLNP
jgi:phage gp45-like